MSFTSLSFLGFVGGVVLLYYLLPKRVQWGLLLAASYGFYLAGGPSTIVYLLFTTAVTYGAGLLLGALNQKGKQLPPQDKKAGLQRIRSKKNAVVLLTCLVNFGLLYFLKYWGFTAEVLDQVTGISLAVPDLLMPLGISFYIFQSIGYVIDCHRGKYPPERNFFRYALFISFFPQVIQGPIARFDQLSPQLFSPKKLDYENLQYGIQLAMWGYFKKLVLAERIGVMVNTVYSDYGSYPGSILAFATLGYCIQLYCDFSGGIDITRGIAKMLGIDLAENFRCPIYARSLTDYWRRWHITLGSWMRDYVFYPLALSKPFRKLGSFGRAHLGGVMGKILATSAATFVVYFIIGIWHGANFRYIFYGFYNGILITAGLLLEPAFVKLRAKLPFSCDSRGFHGVQMVRTWLIVFVGRYITRAPRLLAAFVMLKETVLHFQPSALVDGTILTLGIGAMDYMVVFLGMAVILLVEWYQEKGGHARKWLSQRSACVQVGAIMIPLLVIVLLGAIGQNYVAAEFIYAQF